MAALKICVSGTKSAGKNTLANFIVGRFLNRKQNTSYGLDQRGFLCMGSPDVFVEQVTDQFAHDGVKVYSFADPLKRFCIDVLGASYESCYGTDVQKNSPIPHLLWENLPEGLRQCEEVKKQERFVEFMRDKMYTSTSTCFREGPITGRELMQIIGTDFCRKLYGDCWAVGTYNAIARDNVKLAIICDGRFPNEIDIGRERKVKSIRLGRRVFKDNHRSETALDNYPVHRYSKYIDNSELSIHQTCEAMASTVDGWFNEASL